MMLLPRVSRKIADQVLAEIRSRLETRQFEDVLNDLLQEVIFVENPELAALAEQISGRRVYAAFSGVLFYLTLREQTIANEMDELEAMAALKDDRSDGSNRDASSGGRATMGSPGKARLPIRPPLQKAR